LYAIYRMNIYNTDFKVKYHDIKEELTWKFKNKTPEELELNPDPEYEYSNQDVLDICDKLYRDELCSVFYADNIIDDKIDNGMKYVLEKMMLNNDFKLIINEMKNVIMMNDVDDLSEQEQQYFTQNFNFMLMVTLFKKDIFYLFHKCICQQLTLGTIDSNLLDEIKKNTIDVIKTK
jgi:hypothetical protein